MRRLVALAAVVAVLVIAAAGPTAYWQLIGYLTFFS